VTSFTLAQGVSAQQLNSNGSPSLDPAIQSYTQTQNLEGRFTIAGSNTMYPLMTRLAAEFKRRYPGVQIGIEGRGSKSLHGEDASGSGPFWRMIQNKSVYRRGDGSDDGHHVSMQVHILASSTKLTPQEIRTFVSRYGYEPLEMPIALEAVAVYVHRDNPLPGLTLEQLDAIFSETRRRGLSSEIKTWGQLGLQDGWQEAPLRLYGRDQKSGTRAFIREQVLLAGEFRPTVKEVPGSAMLILEVARDQYGIGYSSIGYQTSLVRPLPLAPKAGMPFVAPSAESAMDASYPLTRSLYLYINKSPTDNMSSVITEFHKFINSREGQDAVVRAGAYPLSASQVEMNLNALRTSPISATIR